MIIGSGITGASIARTLLQNRAKSSSTSAHPAVIMLEVRDICSGATGRNGGHILETADEYAEVADVFGEESARKLLRFRLAHLREMLGVAEELGLTEVTQAPKVQFLSAYFGEEPWKAAVERLRRFKKGMPEESAEWVSYEGVSIPEVCGDLEGADAGMSRLTDIHNRSSSYRVHQVLLPALLEPSGLTSSSRAFSPDLSPSIQKSSMSQTTPP